MEVIFPDDLYRSAKDIQDHKSEEYWEIRAERRIAI